MGRGRKLRLTVGVAAVALTAAACGSGSSGRPFTLPLNGPCPPKPQGGALCIKVFSAHGMVGDVIGYLSSSDSPLKGKQWRLVLSTYRCDPGTGARAACRPVGTYPANPRRGVPPVGTFCRQPNGAPDTTSPGCHDTLATEYATMGAWAGFPLTQQGYAVPQRTWFCVTEQIASGHRWHAPPPSEATIPGRACSAAAPG
jgi:hypothetical protein